MPGLDRKVSDLPSLCRGGGGLCLWPLSVPTCNKLEIMRTGKMTAIDAKTAGKPGGHSTMDLNVGGGGGGSTCGPYLSPHATSWKS